MEFRMGWATDLERIDHRTDTREILAHAKRQAAGRNYQDYMIIDVDSHHSDNVSWKEVVEYIEDPVVRAHAVEYHSKVASPPYGVVNNIMYYQDVGGRIQHQAGWREPVEESEHHKDVTIIRRAMDSIGLDYMIVFPTKLLDLGKHPDARTEALLARAYDRWLVENILSCDERIKSLLYLPFSLPDEALRTVEEFTGAPGVIGFMVTSTRNKPVHDNLYMKLYAALEERGLPLAFHAGYSWGEEPVTAQMNKFMGYHLIGFTLWNMIHLINWVTNGLPERFPKLKVIWIESGLAWLPFVMQRLDSEYMKRVSEAPLLKRRPSEYIREMYFSSQPMERENLDALELTFRMIHAETQLMFATDWPHWDFDLPSAVFDLPFLSDKARRNILGETALKVFNLERPKGK
ncbi:MAG: amidohydrolase [Candidatus Tectomicrobia bacterium]|nr:amidohydrolase [Candidatus Tectomicrobia bacterium]